MIQEDIGEKFDKYCMIDWKDTIRKRLPTYLKLLSDTQLKKIQNHGSLNISGIYEESISFTSSDSIQELTQILIEYCKSNNLQQPIENKINSYTKLITGIQAKFSIESPIYLYEFEIHKLTDSSHVIYFKYCNNIFKKILEL